MRKLIDWLIVQALVARMRNAWIYLLIGAVFGIVAGHFVAGRLGWR